jgi:uncharacterized membrane protein YadS
MSTPVQRRPFRLDEEWLPVALGALIVLVVLFGIKWQLPRFKWLSDIEFQVTAQENAAKAERLSNEATLRVERDAAAAATELKEALVKKDRTGAGKLAARLAAIAQKVRDSRLRSGLADLSKRVRDNAETTIDLVFSPENLALSAVLLVACLITAAAGIALIGGRIGRFVAGFPVVFAISWLAQLLAGNTFVSYLGLEYVIFALGIGLLISNVFGVPEWLREAVRTEFYIKTGLVLLGAGVLFPEILQAGAVGILQAVLVVFVVWYACFWIARKFKVDDEFAAMLSSAVAICGVSAAIAACGAIQGDKKKLSYTISLVLIVAVPMMIIMPWIARLLGIPELVAGAWMGGTLDTTGSVVAASSLISERAMKVGTIVKFSQNVLIGVAAFILAIWWSVSRKRAAAAAGAPAVASARRPSLSVIWERFPKFVLGFIAVSCLFSFVVRPEVVAQTKGLLAGLRTVWFALAFASIGLETRFVGLVKMENGRPALAFLAAQGLNIVWTLALAWILFGGGVLPLPALK